MLDFFKAQGINQYNILSYIKYKLRKIWVKRKLRHLNNGKYDYSDDNKKFMRKILKYATIHVPYYQKISSTDIKDFPIIGKNDFRAQENSFLSDKKKYLVYQKLTTGGSTGQPFGFMISPQFDDIFQEFLWMQYGFQKGDIILAVCGFEVSKEKQSRHLYWEKVSDKQLPYGGIKLSSVYLNQNTYQYYYEYLEELRPDFIRGYPSALYSLAIWLIDHNMTITFKIKGIQLTSESVFEYQITTIEKAFGTKVFMQYGHTEACVFGYTYDDSHYYRIAPLYGYVEVLNENGEQVEKGQVGEIVVTSYTNFAQPFIRYRTGDLAKYEGSKNGIVELECIYGRTQDFVYNYKKEKVLLTAIIFGLHYQAFNRIIRWQLEQREYGRLTAYIVPSDNYTKRDEEEIKKVFGEQVGIDIEFVYVDELSLTKRGKLNFLLQRICD